ncbi:MAG: hypothetical protein HFH75_07745 [Lachnospiraceae bacterium]|jgi:hypothetical protein|nr:hypothetical protein [Lachnospiraceae bacterium]
MQYEFLKQFARRMKHVGMYALLLQNSMAKQTWKQYGFVKTDEQVNAIFAVMLYIMEQSLREESCTMDDIGAYIDNLNAVFFQKNMSYDDCKKLGDFIVNVILSNEGRAMYFDGFDFDSRAYRSMNVSYIANRIIYVDEGVKRTSYYLTEDGYNLMLSTLEIENNMKLTIHEMIFKLHLEKQSYDKAVEEIKNVFNFMRIQLQKIEEAMLRVRRNALSYSVADYEALMHENMETIGDTKEKFTGYREMVRLRASELEQQNINVQKLDAREEEKLENLRIIEGYLNRTIDEHQKILNLHFDLKLLYDRELQSLAQMSLIRRFSIRTELYDKVLENPQYLENLDIFLRPLFHQQIPRIYNLNKCTELQRPIRKKAAEEAEELLDFDEKQWQDELERRKRERLKTYEDALAFLLDAALRKGSLSLEELRGILEADAAAREICIPSVDVFKEIMVELIRNREIVMDTLRREKSEFITEQANDFQLNDMLLGLTEKGTKNFEQRKRIQKILTERSEDGAVVTFEGVKDGLGAERTIRCTNVVITLELEDMRGRRDQYGV